MAPQPEPSPAAEPVKVEVVRVAEPSRDAGWWVTTVGPVAIAALALLVAIGALADQRAAEKTSETATARTDASEVSFISVPAEPSHFEIDNHAQAQISDVLVQPVDHLNPRRLGNVQPCTGVVFPLSSARDPVIYFRDASGLGWLLPVNGVAQRSAEPSQILDLIPVGAASAVPPAQVRLKLLHGC